MMYCTQAEDIAQNVLHVEVQGAVSYLDEGCQLVSVGLEARCHVGTGVSE